MSLLGRAALGLVLAVAGAGCVAAPAGHDPLTATPVDEIGDPPSNRSLRHATVRVRNLGCGSLGTGSGVVVDDGLIATNRHVVDGARRLEITTWDGLTLEVDVASAASEFDLALVRATGPLPPAVSFADRDLEAGDTVTIAGYPGGRRLTMVTGAVRSVEPFSEDEIGDVALVDAPVRPGNSGGPVGNQAGRLVGLVYAATNDDNDALVIPVSRLRELRDAGGFAPVAPCDPDRVSALDAAAAAGVGQATLPPPPSPTVPLACPAGRPAVELTALEAAQRQETEPAWDVHLDYRLSNDTGQAVSVRQVDVTITYDDGATSTHTFEAAELSAGQETTVEQTVATGRPDAAPKSARIAMAWRWADDTVAGRCPAGE
ncbi:MAG: S1C family serine protease [Acidimicrobiales bacterium]